MSDFESKRENTRQRVFQLLRLIGDLEAQRKYERAVPIANVPAELVCMWFDDVFRPQELPDLPSFFSEKEFEQLTEFSRFYEARVDALPCDHDLDALHRAPEWPAIVARANLTLGLLGVSLADPAGYPKE